MSLLPPVGWADVATRQDLVAFRDGLRAEIADLRTELTSDIAQLRREMHTSIRSAVLAMIGARCARLPA